MKEITTHVEITGHAERVWDVLTDFAAYGEWNTFIRRVSGDLRWGSRLSVQIQPPGRRAMTFSPRITALVPNHELRWVGRVLMPGLFDGEHRFVIESLDPTRVRFVHSERFRGILVPLLWRGLAGPTKEGFKAMNKALKERVEKNPR